MDYEKDIEIDQDALDVEWLAQPQLALRYGKHAAAKRKIAAKMLERIKITKAELIRRANDNPMAITGKDKPTVGDIEAYYRTHPDHISAKEEWIRADYEAQYAEHAYKEIGWTRKQSLENLVTLHGQQYFAGPSVPRNLGKEWAKRQQQRRCDSAVASAMKKSK